MIKYRLIENRDYIKKKLLINILNHFYFNNNIKIYHLNLYLFYQDGTKHFLVNYHWTN